VNLLVPHYSIPLNTMIASLFVFVLLVEGSMSQCTSQLAAVKASDQQAMITSTNAFRSQLAMGKLVDMNQHPMDKAGNMLQVMWNQTLANVAQKWADCCNFEHSGTPGVGENIFEQGGSPMDVTSNFNMAVSDWSSELPNNFTYRASNVFTDDDMAAGHYTQLAWAATSQVGCGYASCPNLNPGMQSVFVVCQYYPPGNYLNQVIYNPNPKGCTSGSACTNTAQKTVCNAQGLCK